MHQKNLNNKIIHFPWQKSFAIIFARLILTDTRLSATPEGVSKKFANIFRTRAFFLTRTVRSNFSDVMIGNTIVKDSYVH